MSGKVGLVVPVEGGPGLAGVGGWLALGCSWAGGCKSSLFKINEIIKYHPNSCKPIML